MPDARCNDRNNQEDHHDEAHQPRHPVTAHTVANNGGGHYAEPCAGNTLNKTQRDKLIKTARKHAGERQQHIGYQAERQYRPSAITIGQYSGKERAEACSEKIGADHHLPFIANGAQIISDNAERRQHCIDTESLQAHQHCHHRDQLALAKHAFWIGCRIAHAMRIGRLGLQKIVPQNDYICRSG